jgi:pimeloyl-ACP methyl ester carboxylesterase
MVKLPPEYHHGRAYPVLIAMTHPNLNAEAMTAALARETDRHGYVLLVPDWSGFFGKGWQWKGEDHDYVTGVLRDAVRHFTVDNDRVFLFGAGDGANAAMDVGLAHPDLFAGVLCMGPIPRKGLFLEYWRNAQKLPFYIVTGEYGADSLGNLKDDLFAKWMPQGFPAVMAVYKGRGIEWYSAEPPVMFDWMARKKRVNGTATLRYGTFAPPPWQTMRETDNRFYWVSADKIDPRNLMESAAAAGRPPLPASFNADLRNGNSVVITSRGVKAMTVWFGRDMINWDQRVSVSINGTAPVGYKPKKLEPDYGVLLEDYHDRGDRRILFLAKLEFPNVH